MKSSAPQQAGATARHKASGFAALAALVVALAIAVIAAGCGSSAGGSSASPSSGAAIKTGGVLKIGAQAGNGNFDPVLFAGAVGDLVGASSSSASFHLSHLERAGLVQSRRAARSIIYTANFDGLSGLVEFLMRDCCQGRPEVCTPASKVAASCCAAAEAV